MGRFTYPYRQERIVHDDGTWSDVSIVKFPADKLRFQDIVLEDTKTRLRDAAHLRFVKAALRGKENPIIVAWACLEDDKVAGDFFPSVSTITEAEEHLISSNSLINYTLRTLLDRHWLFYEDENWQINIPPREVIWHQRGTTILNWLIENNRLWLEAASDYVVTRRDFVDFEPRLDAIPVGRLGFLRRVVQENRYRVAFNTSYFLLEHDDFISHHSALGEPYNLCVSAGEVYRPPLYQRSVFWCDDNLQWRIDRIGMQDVELHVGDLALSHEPKPNQSALLYSINPQTPSSIAVYTRYYGVESHGVVLGHTPHAENRIEFTMIDKRIVSWKSGGNLFIPQNGFVLSFATDLLSNSQFDNILKTSQINYVFSEKFHSMQEAIQCGPRLLHDGEIILSDDSFDEEEFWVSRTINEENIVGVVPTDYPIDIGKVRAGRMGIGIKADGDLVIVAVSGVNSGFNLGDTDSNGASLVELAKYLISAGAVNAMNLDGGGSTQLFLESGAMVRFGDRRGSPGIVYERMIPSVGVVS